MSVVACVCEWCVSAWRVHDWCVSALWIRDKFMSSWCGVRGRWYACMLACVSYACTGACMCGWQGGAKQHRWKPWARRLKSREQVKQISDTAMNRM